MLGAALAIAGKDLRLALAGAQGLVQTVLLGLLLIFIMSLSREPGELVPPLAAAAVFWLATAFGQVLVFNFLYGLEEAEGGAAGAVALPGSGPGGLAGQGCGRLGVAFLLPAGIRPGGSGLSGTTTAGLPAARPAAGGRGRLGYLRPGLASGGAVRGPVLPGVAADRGAFSAAYPGPSGRHPAFGNGDFRARGRGRGRLGRDGRGVRRRFYRCGLGPFSVSLFRGGVMAPCAA